MFRIVADTGTLDISVKVRFHLGDRRGQDAPEELRALGLTRARALFLIFFAFFVGRNLCPEIIEAFLALL